MKDNYNSKLSGSLYHFTNLKTAIELILPTFKLKLGLIESTNDPRENKSFGFGAFNAKFKIGKEIEDHNLWNKKITKLLRKDVKIACFSENYIIDDEYYDGYNLPRMWAQYGDNHKGVCLEFDIDKLKSENEILFNQAIVKSIMYKPNFSYPWVNYDRIREIGLEEYIKEFQKSNVDYLFFSKFIDWQAEREIRLLYFSQNDSEEYISIRKSLKRIILGVDFNDVYLPSILKLSKGIEVEKIIFDDGHLKSFPLRKEYINNIMCIDNKDQ